MKENKNVDTTKTTTHLGLCAGYGGIELGLKRVIPNLRSVALCEIEAFACANLVSKMEAGLLEPAPIWTDLKTFPWDSFRHRVDILTGGYPCQPFSAAGKRLGTDDPRHLWPFIADGIRILRPKLCFFENVEGHISLGLREVIEELGSIGYKTTWGIFSASEVGAPHQRKRVFIMAHRSGERLQGGKWCWKTRAQGESSGHFAECGSSMAHSIMRGMSRSRNELGDSCEAGQGGENSSQNSNDGNVWPSRPDQQQHAWEPPRVTKGMAHAHGSRGEEPEHQQANLPSKSSRGNSEAMGNSAGKRSCGGSEDGPELQPKMFREGYEAVGNANNAGWETKRYNFVPSEGRESHKPSARESNIGESEAVGNSTHRSNGQHTSEQQGRHSVGRSGEEGAMGNATNEGQQIGRPITEGRPSTEQEPQRPNGGREREAESALGRDADGPAGGMDDAELCVACDNRIDELRLLGNGVVPATAERAFRVLMEEIQRPIS